MYLTLFFPYQRSKVGMWQDVAVVGDEEGVTMDTKLDRWIDIVNMVLMIQISV